MRFLKTLARFLVVASIAYGLLVLLAFMDKYETLWYWVVGVVFGWFALSFLFTIASAILDGFLSMLSRFSSRK